MSFNLNTVAAYEFLGIAFRIEVQVWKFLLGYHEYDSTYAEREYLTSVKKSEYEVIKSQWQVRHAVTYLIDV